VAQRIDLNYFKRPTPYKRAKLWLAIAAPAIALVWIGWHVFGHDNRVYSSGRLSKWHAVLEKQCAACHVQQARGFSATAADSACLACHDGPPHHPKANQAKFACAVCHSEHRGRVTLAATSGQACARCHGDPRTGTVSTKFGGRIKALGDGHPEFAVLRVSDGGAPHDPGTIKLNHALHMKAIRRGPNGPNVQLDCADCHRTAASGDAHWEYGDKNYAAAMVSYTAGQEFEPGESPGLPARKPWSDRQLMAPVKFANACAGCHLLTFDKRFDEGVPHDNMEVIHSFLTRKFADYIAVHPEELREVQDPQRNLTGWARGPAARIVSSSQWVTERVAVSEELLWHKTCAQCHGITATPLQDVRIARWDAASGRSAAAPTSLSAAASTEVKLPAIAAARIKLQWLPHARFDHDAHTGFSCTGCHASALTSTQESDILIPGIAMCQKCHAPGTGYAESRCFECHTYHDWAKRKEVKPSFTMPGLQTGGR
jgi:hypothetical protein